MTAQDLLTLTLSRLSIKAIHPLHKAMLEECCENVLAGESELDEETMINAVQAAFLTCLSLFKGIIAAGLTMGDTVNYNYRGLSLVIDKNSPLIQ